MAAVLAGALAISIVLHFGSVEDPLFKGAYVFLELLLIVLVGLMLFLGRKTRITLEEHLRELANTDDVTGLPNRRAFIAAVERELYRSARYGRDFSVAFLDINNFKLVNDRDGHQAGDVALRAIAEVLRTTVRQSDAVARIGGDEFAAVLAETNRAGAEAFCDRVEGAVAERWQGTGLSVAVGVAVSPDDGTTFDELFAAADGRMYAAKRERSG